MNSFAIYRHSVPRGLNEIFRWVVTVTSGNTGLFNSFLASGDFCYQLITFANSLDPDQECWSWSGSVSKPFHSPIELVLKKASRRQQKQKHYPACCKLNMYLIYKCSVCIAFQNCSHFLNSVDPDQLASNGVRVIQKVLLVNYASIQYGNGKAM